jgi:hypothetical protein
MAFPTTSVLAALNGATAENPISEGGKWKILSWCVSAGEIHGSADGYTASTAASELNGCYWTPAEFNEPGVSWQNLFPENLKEEWFALWGCLNPTSHNGYRLRAQPLGTEANFNIVLEKITAGTPSTLGETASLKLTAKDFLGLSAVGGKVISWHKIGEGGAWEELKAIADSTYTKGNVGMEAKSKSSAFGQINFAAGGGTTECHTAPLARNHCTIT